MSYTEYENSKTSQGVNPDRRIDKQNKDELEIQRE